MCLLIRRATPRPRVPALPRIDKKTIIQYHEGNAVRRIARLRRCAAHEAEVIIMQTYQREDLYTRANGSNIIVKYDHHAAPFPVHWHQFCELLYVSDGELNVNVGGNPYLLRKDSLLFVAPCELHSILPSENPKTVLIQYDAALLYRFPSIVSHIQQTHTRLQVATAQHNPALFQRLRTLLFEIVELQRGSLEENPDPFYDVRQYLLLCQMHLLMLEQERTLPEQHKQRSAGKSRNAMRIVQEACAYISQNFTDEITLTQMADRADMSVSHFSRIFEQYTASSFSSYLSQCRLSHAKLLLANRKAKITDIAFQSGFGSLASFNRVFVKSEGMTPSEFRDLYNNS